MSLQTRPIPPIPHLTATVTRRAFCKGNVYMHMRDVLGIFFTDDQFAYDWLNEKPRSQTRVTRFSKLAA